MSSASLLGLPKELLSQILDHLTVSELCSPAVVCGLLNTLCERHIYRSISVVKYAYSHVGKTKYDAIGGFFNAIKKRPQRLSYVKEVDARVELRMDAGLHDACKLFEVLPRMPKLTELTLTVVGGIRPYREHRSLEQSMIWGCTFERGRMAMYKFFRMNADSDELHGLHALQNLRTLKVVFPSNSIGLQTDLMAYSALQHQSITKLELNHIINASLAPPKLPGATGSITHLTMKGCQLPPVAYHSIFESISALEYLDYRPAKRTGYLAPGGLVQALAHHSQSLRSLSIKADKDEMKGMDFSAFVSLRHLEVNNPVWNEDTMEIVDRSLVGLTALPTVFPPYLETLTLKNFHKCFSTGIFNWINSCIARLQAPVVSHLKELRLEAEYLGDEYMLASSCRPMYSMHSSAFHILDTVSDMGIRMYRDLGVKLCVRDTLLFGQEAYTPGPYETTGPECKTLRLSWDCQLQQEESQEKNTCAKAEMSPRDAIKISC